LISVLQLGQVIVGSFMLRSFRALTGRISQSA
jgi:hypothetical protein